jgi:hypothetical protein
VLTLAVQTERYSKGRGLSPGVAAFIAAHLRSPGTDALRQGAAACVAEFGSNPAALVREIVVGAGRDEPAR